jgi:hypothetical protein
VLFFASCVSSLPLEANVNVNPVSLSFGSQSIGTTSQPIKMTLTNARRHSTTLVSISSSVPQFSYSWPSLPLTLSAAQQLTGTAIFKPAASQIYNGTLTFTFASGPSIVVSLSGTGVQAQPLVTIQPASETVITGQTATFSASVSGASPVGYQWKKNGAAISGATAAGYTTPPATASDNAAQFTVTVSTATGSVTSNPATLTVTASAVAPSITSQPISKTVTAGQTATFSVAAAGTVPLSYKWMKNGTPITGATSSTYTTPATTTSDNSSQFTVMVGNSAGSVTSNPATLTVTASVVAPLITTQPVSRSVAAGQTATFSVAATGTAPLSYKWMKSGTPITGATSSTYTTPATTTSDNSSQFTVTVSNSSGSVTSNPATLTVGAITSQLTASPSTLSFGNINVGASSSQNVTLTNSSSANITISNVSISGPGFNVSGVPSGLILAAGKIATLNLTFAPTASGSVTGSVIVTSNATNSPAPISLSGSGVPTVSTGSQFYVSPTGNDANSGTNSSVPWRTIQKAMNNATAGSTVNIMAGTYHERLTLGVSGTAGNYITFQPNGFSVPSGGCGGYTGVPCGGDKVILDYGYLGTVTDTVPFLQINGKSYVRIQGMTFQNFMCTGAFQQGVRVDNGSSFVEFNYNKFLNNQNIYVNAFDGTTALLHIRVWSPSNNVTFYGNELGTIKTNMSEALTFDGSGTSGVLVENNWIHDTDGIGIDVHGGANNYTIRGNKLEYISIKRDGSVWYGQSSTAIYNDGGNTGVMERNFIDHTGEGFQALSEPGQPATHDVTIRNNVVQNSQYGIVLGTWYSNTDGSSIYNIHVFNNTFYSNSTGIFVRPMTSASVSWENNIFANNSTAYVNTLNWNPGTANYNLYFGGGTGPGANSVTLNPLFNNALAGDLSLQPTSPAINAGDPSTSATVVGAVDFAGNPRILGGRIDIGAYEVH